MVPVDKCGDEVFDTEVMCCVIVSQKLPRLLDDTKADSHILVKFTTENLNDEKYVSPKGYQVPILKWCSKTSAGGFP